jgi:hypothetical protein
LIFPEESQWPHSSTAQTIQLENDFGQEGGQTAGASNFVREQVGQRVDEMRKDKERQETETDTGKQQQLRPYLNECLFSYNK